MRRILLLLAAAGLTATGCTRYEGPLEVRRKGRPDLPGYSIPEQERRARERLTTIEDDFRVGPRTYADRPDPVGRSAGVYGGP
jgi:hypothetical protein